MVVSRACEKVPPVACEEPSARGTSSGWPTMADADTLTDLLQSVLSKSPRLSNIMERHGAHVREHEEEPSRETSEKLVATIRENVIGKNLVFHGPVGPRPMTYCDYIASGRALAFIEDFIRDEVLPSYGNTHSETTMTATQTTHFREEARDIVAHAVNADSQKDAVIFTGSGCTGAVSKLVHAIKPLIELSKTIVVFVSIMEHHSNLLPWRELPNAKIVVIQEDKYGRLDLKMLEEKLKENRAKGYRMIGCFTAASNVTGVMNDDITITKLLHEHDALAFFDYAAAAPYVNIDMNPNYVNDKPANQLLAKDAIYFSMHKFVGGVQTPGVLVAKRKIFVNPVPHGTGGGTVLFVTEKEHCYLSRLEMREEGGTPSIVGGIRAGLTMQLKESVTADYIMRREAELMVKVRQRLKDMKNLFLLGNPNLPRLPIISFLIRHPESGAYLHHNFVCALLTDVYGIEARGGCACAGPYGLRLLGINVDLSDQFMGALTDQLEVLKPGFSRLNLSWFADDNEIEFVLQALKHISEHGWKLLPQYRFKWTSGSWQHVAKDSSAIKSLQNVSYATGSFAFVKVGKRDHQSLSHKSVLQLADALYANAKASAQSQDIAEEILDCGLQHNVDQISRTRWFLLPSEAQGMLCRDERIRMRPPFQVKQYEPLPPNVKVSTGSLHLRLPRVVPGLHPNTSFARQLSLMNLIDPKFSSMRPDAIQRQMSEELEETARDALGDLPKALGKTSGIGQQQGATLLFLLAMTNLRQLNKGIVNLNTYDLPLQKHF